uniref:Uncharacterized protein n=1 Tax=Brassica oleracea TaxID=3712 RepID=A0A3P6D864_BRAOL|nr:unnamed protein product [Brassica oleracea]
MDGGRTHHLHSMLWDCKHWVGLAINLDMGKVTMCELTGFSGVKSLCGSAYPIYYNNRIRLIAARRHEVHGDARSWRPAPHMSGITDQAVDNFRKQYALDIYKTIVMPAYSTQVVYAESLSPPLV